MLTPLRAQWFPRVFTFLVWALVASSAVFWGLRWQGKSDATTLVAPMAQSAAPVDASAVALLLGSAGAVATPVAVVSNRFALAGVVAQAGSRTGAALIGVDGKPAKSYSVGSRVEEGLWLVSVAARRASLGTSADGPASIVLDLPAPVLASTSKAAPPLAAPLPAPMVVASAPAEPLAQAPDAPAARSRRRIRNAGTADKQD